MSLSSSLFSGISGLSTFGNAMQILGDNIANVNTIGFKSSHFTFQDLLSQSVATSSGSAQVGRGTTLGSIMGSFEQGSFESTGNTTDLAIGGEGFFTVREAGAENYYYTRAGNFSFDENGQLTNPEGLILQGWKLDENGDDVGSKTDIVMSSFTSPPDETTETQAIVNLDSDGLNNSSGSNTALSAAWDATAVEPLGENAYEYQTTLLVYDSLGSTHDVTMYFDKGETDSVYEYILTSNPAEDNRSGASGQNWQGLLSRGLINFDTSGAITSVTMDRFDAATTGWVAQAPATDLTDGHFTYTPSFISGTPMEIQLNLGTHYDGTTWVNGSLTTTSYAVPSTTTFESSNGYGAGDLENVTVDVDGTMTGHYSNGQLAPLYRVSLAKFQNEQGLLKKGGSLYSETKDSGEAITSKPGTNGLGSISPNSLEQSNVDIADELVKMITTQRGFQANSKIITVTDQMLQDLINIKR